MSSFYTGDQLKEFSETREKAKKRYYDISEKCLSRAYKSERAQEFATHGFCRRLRECFIRLLNKFSWRCRQKWIIRPKKTA